MYILADCILSIINTILDIFLRPSMHQSYGVSIVLSGRNPKQENEEIGEFVLGRPDFGGR